MAKTREYESDNLIDLEMGRLPEQWVEQVRLYRTYSTELADARMELEEAKASLELIEADLSLSIRNNPTRHGLEKVTESGVEKAVILHPNYQEAKKREIKAKHRVDILTGTMGTLDNRKRALEKMVDLLINDLYAEPKQPQGDRESFDRMTKAEIRKRGQIKTPSRD